MTQPSFRARRACTFALLIALGTLGGCHDTRQEANRENFTAAVNEFLAAHGHLCMAKYDWPIYVGADDVAAGSRDAVQMPVLETIGLVAGKDAVAQRKDENGRTVTAHARAYVLTAQGLKYYLHSPVVVATATSHVTHPADLCGATLSLDKVTGWETPVTQNGQTVTSVLYTYRIDPAPWLRDRRVLRAFPMVARVLEGEGVMELREGMHLTPAGWKADEVLQR
jgi:hypothetical protein